MVNSRNRAVILKIKTADTLITSDATYNADDHLITAVKANTDYFFQLTIFIKSHATPDLKYKLSKPSGATCTGTAAALTGVPATETVYGGLNVTCDDTNQLMTLTGRLLVSTTAGNFSFDWAQNTLDANETRILQGSSLLLIEATI